MNELELNEENKLSLSSSEYKDPEVICEFCGSDDGVSTFYVGPWDNQVPIGRVCIRCWWKAISNSLRPTNTENGTDPQEMKGNDG